MLLYIFVGKPDEAPKHSGVDRVVFHGIASYCLVDQFQTCFKQRSLLYTILSFNWRHQAARRRNYNHSHPRFRLCVFIIVSPIQSVSRTAHYVMDTWTQKTSAKDAGTLAIRFIGLRTCHSSESKQSYGLHSYRLEWGEGVSALISNPAARVEMYIRTFFGKSRYVVGGC